MTRALARDLGSREFAINNVQPGRIDTVMNPANGPMADQTWAQLHWAVTDQAMILRDLSPGWQAPTQRS
jgi:NAD(P)-dependent dehydrogenase (short-subunit alcohol dehydrogenase family)